MLAFDEVAAVYSTDLLPEYDDNNKKSPGLEIRLKSMITIDIAASTFSKDFDFLNFYDDKNEFINDIYIAKDEVVSIFPS